MEQVFDRLYQYYIVNLFKTKLTDQISHVDTELLDSPKDNGSLCFVGYFLGRQIKKNI